MNKSLLLLPSLLLSSALLPASGLPATEFVLDFDPAQTSVEYTLQATAHTVHGTFRLKSGAIRFDPATGNAGGQLVIDATSGESGSAGRDGRMHKNVLESSRFPEITFTPNRVEGRFMPEGPSQLQVHGRFKIHGAEHELVLPIQVQASAAALTADTAFEVPYVNWGMKNPSTLFLRVSEKVQIRIHAAGRPRP